MAKSNWRTPLAVLICGGIILSVSLGTRHTFGLYLQPMTIDLSWSRETFALAIAIQNLVYGFATPVTGMIADRWGTARVLVAGAALYALGIVAMAYSTTGSEFGLSAGLLVGIGLSCTGFSPVFGVVARAFPPEKRTLALGFAGSAGSFGQFLMLPYGQTLI
ncbi:MAG TPA: MFS transporter, partial [Burkholderiales bacterium]